VAAAPQMEVGEVEHPNPEAEEEACSGTLIQDRQGRPWEVEGHHNQELDCIHRMRTRDSSCHRQEEVEEGGCLTAATAHRSIGWTTELQAEHHSRQLDRAHSRNCRRQNVRHHRQPRAVAQNRRRRRRSAPRGRAAMGPLLPTHHLAARV
jgi:hypothetical protein